jgi:ABC-type antimicrobial peptide transport system permease subunit
LPVFSITTMDAHVQYGKPLLPARLGAMLVGAFGLLGLVLASVGVYGVISYSVSQRTQEIGIRTALGAQRSNVLSMVLKQGMSMALIGTVIGVVLALLLFRGLHTVLYGVQSTDFVTMGGVSALLLTVAFLASYVPALRATRVDPVTALRNE